MRLLRLCLPGAQPMVHLLRYGKSEVLAERMEQ
jgi:hypothetical protein